MAFIYAFRFRVNSSRYFSAALEKTALRFQTEESGHKVELINVCKLNVNPCIGCVACGYEGDCVQFDDNQKIRKALLSCDMVVFAIPLSGFFRYLIVSFVILQAWLYLTNYVNRYGQWAWWEYHGKQV